MKALVAGLTLIGLSTSTAAQSQPETWRCKDGFSWDSTTEILVVATINEDRETGTIAVAGTVHDAVYVVHGFERRWGFGEKLRGDSYRFVFAISPNGAATYYDSIEGSRMTLNCKQDGK